MLILMSVYGPRPFCSRPCYLKWPGMGSWDGGPNYYPEAYGQQVKRVSKPAVAGGSKDKCNGCGAPLTGAADLVVEEVA